MLKLASTADSGHVYVSFEHAQEIEHVQLNGLGYFRKALGMSDYLASFKSWIKRPEPILLGCMVENQMVGWCMFEKWDRNDKDGTPISVLRTIEVRPKDRGKRIGLNLVALMANIVPGHMATRPFSLKAKQFFEGIGFLVPPKESQIAFENRYGYLLLPSIAKRSFLKTVLQSELSLEVQSIEKCSLQLKTQVLREEISHHTGFGQAFLAAVSKNGSYTDVDKIFIKTDTAAIPCSCGSRNIDFFSLSDGDLEHLMVECNRCGDVWVTVPV